MNEMLYILVPLVFYLSLLAAVVMFTGKNMMKGDKEYFLAGRSIGVFASFISVVATETSVATIVAFPAIGYAHGLSFLWLPAGYIFGRILVANYYLGKLYESDNISIYSTISNQDYFSKNVLSSFYLLAKFIANGVRLFLGAFALQQLFGWEISGWILVSAVTAGVYSLTGGLRAVVLMDQFQGFVIYAAGFFFCIFIYIMTPDVSFQNLKWVNLDFSYSNNANSLLLFFGGAVLSIGTHGSDQDMLQRILGAKGFKEARRSLIYSGFGAFIVILVYLFAGFLLAFAGKEGIDTRSPLISFIEMGNVPILKSFLSILIFAATSSTLDSSIHSTGAVWKGLIQSDLPGRFWSFISLIMLSLFAMMSIYLHTYSPDFLTFAMGSMNYVNGGLIGIITVFTFFSDRLTGTGIVLALVLGFAATAAMNWFVTPAFSWPLITLVSSSLSFAACYGYGMLKTVSENRKTS